MLFCLKQQFTGLMAGERKKIIGVFHKKNASYSSAEAWAKTQYEYAFSFPA
jgi:hypothetical protein